MANRSYKTYGLNTDIRVAFQTDPVTTGITASLLRAKYFEKAAPATKVDITGTITEDAGVYFTPAFQIDTEGDYLVEMEYDKTADGSGWTRVGISEIKVGDEAGTGTGTGTTGDWRMRAVV